MSAVIKVVPRDKRLRVTAKYNHETIQFGGNIFEFIEHLKRERLTGKGTFSLNAGEEYGLEFDLRKLNVDETPGSVQ